MRIERLLILVPCHNEARNIGAVLEDVRRHAAAAEVPFRILVIDDGSTDGTAAAAAGRATVLRLPVNCGVEAALHAGYVYAAREGFDACLHIDGDGQHPAEFIPALVAAAERTGSDLVLGSRYIQSEGFRSSRLRRAGKNLIGALTRLRYGLQLIDPTSGYKLATRRVVARFAAASALDYHEPVSLSLITSHGFSFTEVPVVMRPRLHGRSYLSGLSSVTYMIRVLLRLLVGVGRTTEHDAAPEPRRSVEKEAAAR